MAGGVVLGINHDDIVTAPFAISVQRVASYGVRAIWCRGYAGRLDRGRNEVMAAFLKDYDEEWLLMVDSDMVFRPSDVAELMKKADAETNPLTGGLYVREDQQPVALKYNDEGLARPWDGKGRGLVKVDILGFGFTAIHRSVLEAMEDNFCDNGRFNDWGHSLSDDSSFFWRARGLGYGAKLNTDVKLGHTKSLIFFPEGYE